MRNCLDCIVLTCHLGTLIILIDVGDHPISVWHYSLDLGSGLYKRRESWVQASMPSFSALKCGWAGSSSFEYLPLDFLLWYSMSQNKAPPPNHCMSVILSEWLPQFFLFIGSVFKKEKENILFHTHLLSLCNPGIIVYSPNRSTREVRILILHICLL